MHSERKLKNYIIPVGEEMKPPFTFKLNPASRQLQQTSIPKVLLRTFPISFGYPRRAERGDLWHRLILLHKPFTFVQIVY